MPRLLQLAGLFAALASPVVSAAVQVVDRIVAHVEDDVLFQSELRELGQFQQLAGGQSETDAQLLDRLVDQWIVKTEADAARFPPPSATRLVWRAGKPLAGNRSHAAAAPADRRAAALSGALPRLQIPPRRAGRSGCD
jgi:hypothetical protein